ncbi:MAG: hypothetical protein QOG23_684 [Blastocatellia bacterium]|nr:hypothetical protein [Blastocatellia bacterium]
MPIAEGQILVTERGHPVRLSAKREQVVRIILSLKAERAAHAGGQDVRAPVRVLGVCQCAFRIWHGEIVLTIGNGEISN